MSALESLWDRLKPCDPSPAFQALDRADAAARLTSCEARKLSRLISCGDPIAFVERLVADTSNRVRFALRRLHVDMLDKPVPEDMTELLAQIDEGRSAAGD